MPEEQLSLQAVSRQLIELSLARPPTYSFNRQLLRIVVEAVGALGATLWLLQKSELVRCEDVEDAVETIKSIRLPEGRQQECLRTSFDQGCAVVVDDAGQGFDPFRPPSSQLRTLAFVPVAGLSGPVGVIRLVMPPLEPAALSRAVQLAEALAGYYSLYGAQRILTIQQKEREDIDRLSKAILQLQHFTFSHQLPEVIVNSAVEIARVDRVVLLTGSEEELQVAAVSSVSESNRKGAWSRAVCELGEVLLHGERPLHFFPGRSELEEIEDEELRQQVNSYCLMTEARSLLLYPLSAGGEKAGVLMLEGFGEQPVSSFERALGTVYAAHAGSALANHRLFERVPMSGMFARRLDREAQGIARRPSRVGRWVKWALIVAVVAAGGWFVAVRPVAEKVRADCLVAPAETRIVTARVAGEVEEVNFRQGQRVAAGHLLVKMRTDEIDLQLARELENAKNIQARIVKLRGEAEKARQPEDQAGSLLAEIRAMEHTLAAKREEIKLLEAMREDCYLRAPIAGSAVEPEHPERMLGVVVREGEPLCRIGSIAERVRLRIAVPAERAPDVHAGQAVEVQLRSLLTRKALRGTIAQVAERSVTYKNANVFMAELTVPNPAVPVGEEGEPQFLLKPGMTGKARIIQDEESTYLSIYARAAYRKLRYWVF